MEYRLANAVSLAIGQRSLREPSALTFWDRLYFLGTPFRSASSPEKNPTQAHGYPSGAADGALIL
jgi:hypothetical protein